MIKPIVLKVGHINTSTGNLTKEKVVGLTYGEIDQILKCLQTQISWGAGGCYGDGDTITEKADYRKAKSVYKKFYKVVI